MIRFDKQLQGTRNSDDYTTPKQFYEQLNREFRFDMDPCPLRSRVNGLEIDWKGNVYVNPPYSNIGPFIRKGIEEIRIAHATMVVFLLPVRTDTQYWHQLIFPHASELRFVRGRLHFNDAKSPAPFPVVVVVFDKYLGITGIRITSLEQQRSNTSSLFINL